MLELTFVPLLSTMRVLMPHLASHVAIMRPAGPAPTMRTSTWSVFAPIAIFACISYWLGWSEVSDSEVVISSICQDALARSYTRWRCLQDQVMQGRTDKMVRSESEDGCLCSLTHEIGTVTNCSSVTGQAICTAATLCNTLSFLIGRGQCRNYHLELTVDFRDDLSPAWF